MKKLLKGLLLSFMACTLTIGVFSYPAASTALGEESFVEESEEGYDEGAPESTEDGAVEPSEEYDENYAPLD